MAAQDEEIETALWQALRALEERITLRRRLAAQARRRSVEGMATHLELGLDDAEHSVQVLRGLLRRNHEVAQAAQ